MLNVFNNLDKCCITLAIKGIGIKANRVLNVKQDNVAPSNGVQELGLYKISKLQKNEYIAVKRVAAQTKCLKLAKIKFNAGKNSVVGFDYLNEGKTIKRYYDARSIEKHRTFNHLLNGFLPIQYLKVFKRSTNCIIFQNAIFLLSISKNKYIT